MSTQFGKYLLQRKLAEGGMAEVFLAKQSGMEGFEKPVVVKRILPHLCHEDAFVEMFLNEARVAARLSHPSIVQIFDLGKVDEQYYIAMEFIHGEDLRSIAKQAEKARARPSFAIVARIMADMLGALHYAHTRAGPDGKPLGLVHRDISPQNTLVTFEGGVKLVDFGIAKATESQAGNQTQAGLLKGKYAYMSPEQCRGKKLDARSDIFSVGILLWELITWRRLFRRDNDLATLVAVADDPIPTLSSLRNDVPPELDAICMKSLERDVNKRYPSAQAMQSDLEICIRKYAWEADTISLSRYMRSCFEDKLRLQDDAVRAAGVGSLEDFLVKVDGNQALAWMEPKNPTNQTPATAMPFRDPTDKSQPVPRVSPSTGNYVRVQPPAPGEVFTIAPVPNAPAPPYPTRDETTPSTMRHAVGQKVSIVEPTHPGIRASDILGPPPSSGAKRFVIVGLTGLVLAAAVLGAVLWPEAHPAVKQVADVASVATLRVQLDVPAQIFIDGALQPPGKNAELQVTAGVPHEVRIKHGADAELKVDVPALEPGAVEVVKKHVGG